VLAVVLTAAIVVPAYLYTQEREQRLDMSRAYSRLHVESSAELNTLASTLQTLVIEQDQLRTLLLDAGYAVVSGDRLWLQLLATGYSSTVWETDDTPFITASNTRTRTGVVALSRDLLTRYSDQAPFKFGDAIHISGLGEFSVEDSMHGRWRRRVDIWFPSRSDAWEFGKRRVTVTMPLLPTGKVTNVSTDIVVDRTAASSYASSSTPTE